MKNIDSLNSLHKYFIWADAMRLGFERELVQEDGTSKDIYTFMYMSLWYGLLYVVIEGWNDLKLSDDTISGLVVDKKTDLLKGYRHATFHYQKDYYEKRVENFFLDKTTVNWVRDLHSEFNNWFI